MGARFQLQNAGNVDKFSITGCEECGRVYNHRVRGMWASFQSQGAGMQASFETHPFFVTAK